MPYSSGECQDMRQCPECRCPAKQTVLQTSHFPGQTQGAVFAYRRYFRAGSIHHQTGGQRVQAAVHTLHRSVEAFQIDGRMSPLRIYALPSLASSYFLVCRDLQLFSRAFRRLLFQFQHMIHAAFQRFPAEGVSFQRHVAVGAALLRDAE